MASASAMGALLPSAWTQRQGRPQLKQPQRCCPLLLHIQRLAVQLDGDAVRNPPSACASAMRKKALARVGISAFCVQRGSNSERGVFQLNHMQPQKRWPGWGSPPSAHMRTEKIQCHKEGIDEWGQARGL